MMAPNPCISFDRIGFNENRNAGKMSALGSIGMLEVIIFSASLMRWMVEFRVIFNRSPAQLCRYPGQELDAWVSIMFTLYNVYIYSNSKSLFCQGPS